jgi:hypothetical protein
VLPEQQKIPSHPWIAVPYTCPVLLRSLGGGFPVLSVANKEEVIGEQFAAKPARASQ